MPTAETIDTPMTHLFQFSRRVFKTLGTMSLLAVCQSVGAQPSLEQTGEMTGLVAIDWMIILLYATSTIALGWYFGRKQETTKEYFVGSGNMNWFLIGVSLFATLLSTISYLSMPGEVAGRGPVAMVRILGLPIAFVIVGYGLAPVYMRQRVTSAYELLEQNLDLSVRLLGVAMFLALRLVWMSLLVYLASKALIVMMGVDESYIPWIVLATGLVAVLYTSLGGLRAVVVTDLIQTILLFGGALLVLGVITWDFGGFGWFPTEWQESWDTQPIFSMDPNVRVTAFGTVLAVVCWYVATAGGDQVSIQRFMATGDAAAARRAYGTQMVVSTVVVLVLFLVGLALLGYFRAHPEWLPDGMNLRDNADNLFPLFISHHLPAGVSGLVVAAMFAAAMSSIDSGVNSITAVVMTDLLDRFGLRPKTEKAYMRTARFLAFGIGATIVVGSMFVEHIPGNFMAVTEKAVNLLVTPIFSLFFFALFVPFARPLGVWAGWFVGTSIAILIAFSGPIFGYHPETGYDPVSFQWIAPSALASNLIVGTLVSWFLSRQEPQSA